MNEHEFFIEWALAKAAGEPLVRRVKIYRAMSDFVGGEKERESLLSLASELEEADRRCQEFAFKFSFPPKSDGSPSGNGQNQNPAQDGQ
jgi:hypothetical protein